MGAIQKLLPDERVLGTDKEVEQESMETGGLFWHLKTAKPDTCLIIPNQRDEMVGR